MEYTGLLYYGLRAALMRTIPYTGMRMTLYTVLKGTGAGLEESPVVLAAMAAVAGVISQLLLSPIDLFKVRMQADAATVRRGGEPVYKSLPELIGRVSKEEGILAMWTGCGVNAMRAVFMNVADLAVTDVARGILHKCLGAEIAANPIILAAITGISVVLIVSPADTVRSKLMNNGPSSPNPKYTGIVDTVSKTWQQNGLRGFYGAVVPMYLREGPYYLVMWNVLALLRHMRAVAVSG